MDDDDDDVILCLGVMIMNVTTSNHAANHLNEEAVNFLNRMQLEKNQGTQLLSFQVEVKAAGQSFHLSFKK